MSIISFCNPSFATDPDIPASITSLSCDDSVLSSDNGPVNIEINWEPNEINLKWYDNNTLLTVDTTSNTCTYDSGLTPPTPPTRTGYTFKGWRARPPYNFATLSATNNGQHSWGKGLDSNGIEVCFYDGTEVDCDSDNEFTELRPQEWKVQFDYGTVYGMVRCRGSAPNSSFATREDIGDTDGRYPWCKATGYKPANSNTIYGPANTMLWGFQNAVFASVASCIEKGARVCIDNISSAQQYRRCVYGQEFNNL